MLVLSRRIGEEIVVGDNIRLTLVSVQGGRIKLGISAPPSVAIRRAEIAPAGVIDADGDSSEEVEGVSAHRMLC